MPYKDIKKDTISQNSKHKTKTEPILSSQNIIITMESYIMVNSVFRHLPYNLMDE